MPWSSSQPFVAALVTAASGGMPGDSSRAADWESLPVNLPAGGGAPGRRSTPTYSSLLTRPLVDNERLDRCFQLMETDNPAVLEVWRARWADLVEFDVFPVVDSGEAARRAGAR